MLSQNAIRCKAGGLFVLRPPPFAGAAEKGEVRKLSSNHCGGSRFTHRCETFGTSSVDCGKTVYRDGHACGGVANPADEEVCIAVLGGEVGPVPDGVMVKGGVAEFADGVHARGNLGACADGAGHIREDAFDDFVPDFVVADIEQAGPKAEAEFCDEVGFGDCPATDGEALLGGGDGVALWGCEKWRTGFEPFRACESADFRMDGIAEADFEDLESGVKGFAESGIPKVTLKGLDIASAFRGVGVETRRRKCAGELLEKWICVRHKIGFIGRHSPGAIPLPASTLVMNLRSFFARMKLEDWCGFGNSSFNDSDDDCAAATR